MLFLALNLLVLINYLTQLLSFSSFTIYKLNFLLAYVARYERLFGKLQIKRSFTVKHCISIKLEHCKKKNIWSKNSKKKKTAQLYRLGEKNIYTPFQIDLSSFQQQNQEMIKSTQELAKKILRKTALRTFEVIWSGLNFKRAVFHKFHLAYS